GIIGLETAVGLILSEFVNKGIISIHRMIELFAVNPRKILGLDPILIKIGQPANLTIFSVDEEWIVDKQFFKSKSKNTPFDGFRLKGKPKYVINKGMLFTSNL
ncbi:MAG: dihydroorotase, partial [Candidatus Kapaibacteriota bacterium]